MLYLLKENYLIFLLIMFILTIFSVYRCIYYQLSVKKMAHLKFCHYIEDLKNHIITLKKLPKRDYIYDDDHCDGSKSFPQERLFEIPFEKDGKIIGYKKVITVEWLQQNFEIIVDKQRDRIKRFPQALYPSELCKLEYMIKCRDELDDYCAKYFKKFKVGEFKYFTYEDMNVIMKDMINICVDNARINIDC